MGSATTQALAAAATALAGTAAASRLETGRELFAAASLIADSAPLRSALADGSADPASKASIVDRVFASIGVDARAVLAAVARERWSNSADLVAGVEELAVRAVASSAPASLSIPDEFAVFADAVRSDPELEYAVGSALVSGDRKAKVVEALLGGKASAQTVTILGSLLAATRSRRIGELLRWATGIVADEAGKAVATVESATELTPAQLRRIGASLTARAGREVAINQVVAPALIGGVRIRLGDEVIDGTVSRRLAELRRSLAG